MASNKLTTYQAGNAIDRVLHAKYSKVLAKAWNAAADAIMAEARRAAETNPHKFTKQQIASGLVHLASVARVDFPRETAGATNSFRPANCPASFSSNYIKVKRVYCLDVSIQNKIAVPSVGTDYLCKTPAALGAADALLKLVRELDSLHEQLGTVIRPGRSISAIEAEYPYLKPYLRPKAAETNSAKLAKALGDLPAPDAV